MTKEKTMEECIEIIRKKVDYTYGDDELTRDRIQNYINIERSKIPLLFNRLSTDDDFYAEEEFIYIDLERRDTRLLSIIPNKERVFIEKWRIVKELYPTDREEYKRWGILYKIEEGHIVGIKIRKYFNFIPKEIINLTHLREFILRGNNFVSTSTFPSIVCKLKNLRKLDLTRNKLRSLPESIGELEKLEELDLYGNELLIRYGSLPESFFHLPNLRILNLGSNSSFVERDHKPFDVQIISKLGELCKLEELCLVFNDLESLPEGLGRLRKLKTLNLSYNLLGNLPKDIGEINGLRNLILYMNRFAIFPLCILKITSLEGLNLSDNLYCSEPSERLSTIPDEISQLSKLKVLYLSRLNISKLPDGIGDLKELEILALDKNKLRHLSTAITQLPKLRGLYIGQNEIADLSNISWQKLVNLEELDISKNRYKPKDYRGFIYLSIPDKLSQIKNLRSLGLANLSIQEVPEFIGEMTKLEFLNLSNNWLKELPQNIAQLKNLTQLFLEHNLLENLPPNIIQLRKLTELDLTFNNFKAFSNEIGEWLLELDARGCYMYQFSLEKFKILPKLPPVEKQFLREMEDKIGQFQLVKEGDDGYDDHAYFTVKNNQLIELYIFTDILNKSIEPYVLPESIGKLRELRRLYISSRHLKTLPDRITQLTELESLGLGGVLQSSFSSNILEWIIDLDKRGREFYGISIARIKALKSIPLVERQYIHKLEKAIEQPLLLMKDLIKKIIRRDYEGNLHDDFFSVRNNHITIIQIVEYEDKPEHHKEVFDGIEQLEHLEKIFIRGYTHSWDELQKIIHSKFPDRFMVKTADRMMLFYSSGMDIDEQKNTSVYGDVFKRIHEHHFYHYLS